MKPMRFVVDESGLVVSRKLQLDDAVIAANEMMARRGVVLAAMPADLRERGTELYTALNTRCGDLEAALADTAADTPAVPIEPSAEVLRLLTREQALSKNEVNWAIDRRVYMIHDIADSSRYRAPEHPKRQAADLLIGTLFHDGTGFVRIRGPHQWLATLRRWRALDAATLAAAATLGVDDLVEEVGVLNTHYGKILGVTEAAAEEIPASEAPEPAAPDRVGALLDELLATLARAVSLANVAWPDADDPAAVANRVQMIGPYLEKVNEAMAERSLALRAARERKTQ